MKKTVLIPEAVAPEAVRFLEECGYTVKMGRGNNPDFLCEDIRGSDAVLVRTAVIDEKVLQHADQLRVIAKHGAGVDNIDIDAATQRNIKVVNAPLGMTNSVAEYVLSTILALCKCLLACDQQFRQTADFSLRHRFPLCELAGKTVLIAGMGRIGRRVAQLLSVFQTRMIGYDPFVPAEQFPDNVEKVESLDEALSAADIVTLHVPLCKDTWHLLDERRIGLMKPGAFFINAGRGALVDEAALIAALQDGHLAGAGIDVFDPEPPSADHPFFSMTNVIVSPHNSALTPQATVRMAMDAAQGIMEVLEGRSVTWPINFSNEQPSK